VKKMRALGICQRRKLEMRDSPEVRISKSTGGIWGRYVAAEISSTEGDVCDRRTVFTARTISAREP